MTHNQEHELARIAYDEAVQVTDAYRTQLRIRKYADMADQAEKARRIEESLAQLEAAERREYQAWDRMNHLHQLAINIPRRDSRS